MINAFTLLKIKKASEALAALYDLINNAMHVFSQDRSNRIG